MRQQFTKHVRGKQGKEEQKSIIIAQQILFSFYMFSILKTQCTFEDHNLKAMN